MKICLISPTPEEGHFFARCLKSLSGHPFSLYQGKIKKNRILLVVSGIGKVNVATAATYLNERFSPDLFILFGIGGAYPSVGLSIGDIAVAEREFYGDEGLLTKEGFYGLERIGIPLLKKGRKRFFNEFTLNKGLIKKIEKFVKVPFKSGNFVTISATTCTNERALELRDRYDAICENMEGAAVAHVCEVFGKDLLEIRGISNIVDNRDRSRWDVKAGIKAYSDVLFDILNDLF